MGAFWKRDDDTDRLERTLRSRRVDPAPEFLDELEARIRGRRRGLASGRVRVGLGVAVSALALAAIGSAGAVTSVASSAGQLASVIRDAIVEPSRSARPTDANADAGATASARGSQATPTAARPTPASPAANTRQTPAHHQYHITICHHTRHGFAEVTIASSAIPAHARHGDIIPAPPHGCPK
jgi:hypothetical protein